MTHVWNLGALIACAALAAVGWLGACRTTENVELAIARAEDLRVPASPVVLEALEQGSVRTRARAAVAMGRIQHEGYSGALAAATLDASSEVRQAALFALGELGLVEGARPTPPAVEACVNALEDGDPQVVAAAVEALGKLAPDGIAPTIVPLLEYASASVREQAAHALFRLRFVPVWRRQAPEPPPLPAGAVRALIDALSDPSARVRRAAAHVFSRYGQPETVDALEVALGDEDEWVRMFSARAIARSDRPEAVPTLTGSLGDDSAHVRVEAVEAIAALGRVDRLPPDLAGDPSHHVRGAFARALAGGDDDRDLAVLHVLERDASASVAAAAVGSLARRLADAYSEQLAEHLADPRWVVRLAAAEAAAQLASGGGRRLLDQAWTDTIGPVRVAALTGLARTPDGRRFVAEALAEDDLAMRGTAVGLLAALDDPTTALELSRSAYDASAGVEWVEVRESIVDAVVGLDAVEEAASFLRRIAADDPAFSVRRRAGIALGRRGLKAPEIAGEGSEPSPFLGRRFDGDPIVTLETDRGTLRLRCLADEAPIHVASFVDLVEQGHYDGLPWHRVVSNFVIQGGDPRGDGWGGAGYLLRDEINRVPYERGTVGMPKAGKDTGGGQLFITHVPAPHLDGNYTVFARVVSGVEVVDRIEVGDRILRARVESRGDQ